MSFESDIDAWAEKVRANADKLLQETAFQISLKLVEFTPVRTGFLKNSWFATLNAPGDQTETPGALSSNLAGAGSASMTAISLILKTSKAGDIIYIMNNANYARFVNDGTSKMAGRRFVEKAVALGPDIVEKIAREIGNG